MCYHKDQLLRPLPLCGPAAHLLPCSNTMYRQTSHISLTPCDTSGCTSLAPACQTSRFHQLSWQTFRSVSASHTHLQRPETSCDLDRCWWWWGWGGGWGQALCFPLCYVFTANKNLLDVIYLSIMISYKMYNLFQCLCYSRLALYQSQSACLQYVLSVLGTTIPEGLQQLWLDQIVPLGNIKGIKGARHELQIRRKLCLCKKFM